MLFSPLKYFLDLPLAPAYAEGILAFAHILHRRSSRKRGVEARTFVSIWGSNGVKFRFHDVANAGGEGGRAAKRAETARVVLRRSSRAQAAAVVGELFDLS